MSPFRLEILPRFKRARRRKTPDTRQSIDGCVELLSENPRHPGLHSHRVQGTRRVWESYVDEANRVTWQYGESGTIVLRNNCTHDMPGRNP
jgi:hypothetical protein